MIKHSVVDIFCGAGGFSEGFRQQGFDITLGIDCWQPAIDTFNHNYNKNFKVKNVLTFLKSYEQIENLPDSSVIIGSPPCVSFSSSNKSGKADKSLGLQLTKCFLRIVAIKKHKPGSKLIAWFMENVINSKKFLKPSYTFRDLGLTSWAIKNNLSPYKCAITLKENSNVINSAEYGSIQNRKRVIYGEIVKYGKFILPNPTNKSPDSAGVLPKFKSLNLLKENFPSPFEVKSSRLIQDPFYSLSIPQCKITDHFYDTGIYESEWNESKYLKINHPYMGKMSFPENLNAPSRAIIATRSKTVRETILYRSELKRIGNGEYRMPTVREAAIIMGFPITYQFLGSENTKWRLIGNAICPIVSKALAETVRESLNLKKLAKLKVIETVNISELHNLNTYTSKLFDSPPLKIRGAKFRRHPFKDGNITVTLSNYKITDNRKEIEKWLTSVQYGTGEGFPTYDISDGYFNHLEPIIIRQPKGEMFLKIINNGFSEKIAKAVVLQDMHEKQKSTTGLLPPGQLVDELATIINKLQIHDEKYHQQETVIFKSKSFIPLKQLFALYAINKIATTANHK
jgi:DNA (cytosine-5)-methyltransferase 1